MNAAEAAGWGVVAGLAAGAVVYQRTATPKLPPACPPGGGQTILQAIQGWEANKAEDAGLGVLAVLDTEVQGLTFGLYNPGWAADFYAYYEGLTPEQRDAVKQAASTDEACATLETAQQVESAGGSLVAAVLAGLAVYLVLPLALEAK